MRILVTGLDGFTGQYIRTELESHGNEVFGLQSDMTDFSALEDEVSRVKPQAVIHLAGIAFVGHGNANAFYEVNLLGTRNLLEAIYSMSPDVSGILLVSSANIYGNQSEGKLNENTVAAPANDYAVSKFAMEKMADLWVDRLPLFIVRPFNYTGVGQQDKYLIPKIVKHFRDGKEVIELGNLEVWREFGDVRNVAKIYRMLLQRPPVGKVLNICTGQSYSLREVIALCEKITGHKINIKVNPAFVRQNEVRELSGDTTLLRNEIGDWDTYCLEDTLSWMLSTPKIID